MTAAARLRRSRVWKGGFLWSTKLRSSHLTTAIFSLFFFAWQEGKAGKRVSRNAKDVLYHRAVNYLFDYLALHR